MACQLIQAALPKRPRLLRRVSEDHSDDASYIVNDYRGFALQAKKKKKVLTRRGWEYQVIGAFRLANGCCA